MRAAAIWAQLYYGTKARFEVRVLWRVQTAGYFVRLAWLVLRGKLLILDSENRTTRGGHKVFSIIVTKTPVSPTHTYEDL